MVSPLYILCSTRRIVWPVLGCLQTETSPRRARFRSCLQVCWHPSHRTDRRDGVGGRQNPSALQRQSAPRSLRFQTPSLFRYHSAEVFGSFDRTAIEPNPVIMEAKSATLQLGPAPWISLPIRLGYVPLKSCGPLLPEGCSPLSATSVPRAGNRPVARAPAEADAKSLSSRLSLILPSSSRRKGLVRGPGS